MSTTDTTDSDMLPLSCDGEQTANETQVHLEMPKRNSYIRFKSDARDEWQNARSHFKQPKQSGRYNHWVNVTDHDKNEDRCIN